MGYRLPTALVIILLCSGIQPSHASIYCYKCAPVATQYENKSEKICTQFDESEDYETFCQYSSFCMKKVTELPIQHSQTITIEERGCAVQNELTQVYNGHDWVRENVVHEAIYTEGCTDDESSLKAAKTKYCYCSSNYCNSSQHTSESSFFHYTDTMSVIFIFNVVKFLKSVH